MLPLGTAVPIALGTLTIAKIDTITAATIVMDTTIFLIGEVKAAGRGDEKGDDHAKLAADQVSDTCVG